MQIRQPLIAIFLLFSSVSVGLVRVLAQVETGTDNVPSIHIPNFGSVNPSYYRGAQPKGHDYADLAALGVKTIIDVHKNGPKDEARQAAEAGLQFYRIGLSESDVPTAEQVKEFLAIVNDPMKQPVFVHCAGGRHRTGALTAIYRMSINGWTADQAYEEMKKYEFLKDGNHDFLKNYVYEYYSKPDHKTISATQ